MNLIAQLAFVQCALSLCSSNEFSSDSAPDANVLHTESIGNVDHSNGPVIPHAPKNLTLALMHEREREGRIVINSLHPQKDHLTKQDCLEAMRLVGGLFVPSLSVECLPFGSEKIHKSVYIALYVLGAIVDHTGYTKQEYFVTGPDIDLLFNIFESGTSGDVFWKDFVALYAAIIVFEDHALDNGTFRDSTNAHDILNCCAEQLNLDAENMILELGVKQESNGTVAIIDVVGILRNEITAFKNRSAADR